MPACQNDCLNGQARATEQKQVGEGSEVTSIGVSCLIPRIYIPQLYNRGQFSHLQRKGNVHGTVGCNVYSLLNSQVKKILSFYREKKISILFFHMKKGKSFYFIISKCSI